MKVYIGPYNNRWVCYVFTRYMNKKYGVDWPETQTKFENLLEKVEDAIQWVYNHTINKFTDEEKRDISIQIHDYDVWSADHTFSLIAVPLLKKLQEKKHGSPWVDDEDVPDHLKSTAVAELTEDQKAVGDVDDNHHLRWEWVLNEMIWAFEQKTRPHWEEDYYEYEEIPPVKDSNNLNELLGIKLKWEDREGRKAHQDRMSNGFRLFGKYFEALWD